MKENLFDKEAFIQDVCDNIKNLYRKTLEEASQQEIFQAVSYALKDPINDRWIATHQAFDKEDPKIVYYMSMEFLMGRALGNNLINLGEYKEVKEALEEIGLNLDVIEDQEPDPALGNGGLGRLAACFMDSLSTLGYAAYGCGIRYRYGMFKQKIQDGFQIEVPDNWLKNGYPFELRRPEYTYEVKFGGHVRSVYSEEEGRTRFVHEDYQSVLAIPYDMPIVGYGNNVVNTLMIWDASAKEYFELDSFDKGDYQKAVEQQNLARNLVEVLYPNDNHVAGKELRLKQQYFFVSASVQRALGRYKKYHSDIHRLPEKVTFQLNDTYTNHTIMAEALEKWPIEIFQRLLPRIYQIVEEINRRFEAQIRERFPGDEGKVARMAILYNGQVKMAHLAIAAGYSVNGVARLHTEILKNEQLHDFYEMFPQKFNNKTNGITQRRFLMHGNPLLADWVTSHIGDGWITELMQLSRLAPYAYNARALQEFMEIKHKNKVRLAKYIKEHNGIEVNPNSIFDVQVKRLHEYKRQFLNILHVMYLYNELKDHPDMDFYPRTFIFGAKAAAGYKNAKSTIKLINSVADVINNDRSIGGKITGNMKFMLNGALTLGTMDGANVEMAEEVGMENIFIFGMSSDEVIAHERSRDYDPMQIYNNDADVRRVLNQLVDGTYSPNDPGLFRDLYNSLLNTQCTQYADTYFILKDFRSYVDAQKRVSEYYKNKDAWAKSAILNVAHCGKFSSDRTIQEYVNDIWHLNRITVRDEQVQRAK